jgi:glycosyltransferase involved in cell wall biosynthesis
MQHSKRIEPGPKRFSFGEPMTNSLRTLIRTLSAWQPEMAAVNSPRCEVTELNPGPFQHRMTGPSSKTSLVRRRPRAASAVVCAPTGLHVLHVVEALGSGIATALEDYLRSTPEHTHTVLGYRRASAQTGDELERLATRLLPLPEGRLAQIRAVRRWVRELRPDLIHTHSTYAGVYVRLFTRAAGASLVHTPHAYPFERRDVPAALRGLYWLIEALCSLRGGSVAAVGAREAELATRLPGRQVVVQLPNVVRSVRPAPPPAVLDRSGGELRLAMLGRISPQKGPDFFRRAVELSRALALPFRWIWVGGGEPDDERELRQAGAEVTGWLTRSEALGWLAGADVYVHTAGWEGLPVSVLEAAALDLPIVGRRIPALESLAVPVLCDTPEALVAAVRPLADERRRDALRSHSRLLTERHQPAAQRQALELVYSARPPGRLGNGRGR